MEIIIKILDLFWVLGKDLVICVSKRLELVSKIGLEFLFLGSFIRLEEFLV